MSPFKSSAGRQLGKMLEGFKSSDVGKGFGSGSGGGSAQATGGEVLQGTEYVDGNKTYRYHYFKSPGSFIMPNQAVFDGDLDVLVVAGGGSGGNRSGGGAGAGGIAVGTSVIFSGTGQLAIPVVVGNGGSVSGAPESRGNNGQDSRFGDAPNPYSVFAHGGGYGGGDGNTAGGGGGSAGGGHYNQSGGTGSQPGANPGKSWVTNYGSPGSSGYGAPQHQSGAGGGAGGAAGDANSNSRGSAGDGIYLPDWTVSRYMPNSDPYWSNIAPLPGAHFGGGGGAGDYNPYTPLNMPSSATISGGGPGGPASGAGNANPGVNGLGGGGGGGAGTNPGPLAGSGGNGMVVVRYRT